MKTSVPPRPAMIAPSKLERKVLWSLNSQISKWLLKSFAPFAELFFKVRKKSVPKFYSHFTESVIRINEMFFDVHGLEFDLGPLYCIATEAI